VGKAAIVADLVSLVADPDVSVSATVKTPAGSTYAPASGVQTKVTTDDTVTAYLSPLTTQEIADGDYQEGDHRLLVDASLLSVAPTTATEVTVSAIVWRVVRQDLDSISAVHHLILRLSQ